MNSALRPGRESRSGDTAVAATSSPAAPENELIVLEENAETFREAPAVATVPSNAARAILSDIDMPGLNGIALLKRVRQRDLDVPVVFITGSPSVESAIKAMEHGAHRYLVKPVQLEELVEIANDAVRLHRIAKAKRLALELAGGVDRFTGDQAGLVTSFEHALETINLHPSDLLDPQLFATDGPLAAVAERIVLEITERATLQGIDDIRSRVRAARRGFPADIVLSPTMTGEPTEVRGYSTAGSRADAQKPTRDSLSFETANHGFETHRPEQAFISVIVDDCGKCPSVKTFVRGRVNDADSIDDHYGCGKIVARERSLVAGNDTRCFEPGS